MQLPEEHAETTPDGRSSDRAGLRARARRWIKPPVEGGSKPRLVAESDQPEDPAEESGSFQPAWDEGYDYREAVQTLDFEAFERDFDALLTDSQDGGPPTFGHYGPLFVRCPACRRHLPGVRRPRWRRSRHAAVRAAEQLAGQRQPGQGPSPALGAEEEVRQEDLVGRPDRLCGQPGHGAHGFKTAGFAFGRPDLGARVRDIYWGAKPNGWGPRSATPAQATGPSWRTRWVATTMGLIYVNPEAGPWKVIRSDRRGNRHPRDLQPDGDERRRDRRVDRGGHTFGKTHGNGDPDPIGSNRATATGGDGSGLGQRQRHRCRQRHFHQRPRGSPGRTPRPNWDNSFRRSSTAMSGELSESPGGANRAAGDKRLGWPTWCRRRRAAADASVVQPPTC